MNDQEKKSEEEKKSSGTQYKNDNVSVIVEREPGCKVKFDVSVSPSAAQAAYKKSIKLINKEVSLPGFRKGKAPEHLILQNYSKYVDQEWQEILVKTAFHEALTLTNIYPLGENSVQKPQIKKADKDQGAHIIISFESSPEIPDIEPKNLKLNKVECAKVAPKDIESSLDSIRHHHAVWTEVTDRTVQEGDYIDVAIEDLDNPENYLGQNTLFQVAEGKMGAWMKKLVIGKNIDDVVEGVSEKSEDLDLDPEIEFKPTHCKITIKKIKTAELPDIDDALAKKVGAVSVEELREKVERNLELNAEEDMQEKLRGQLEKIIIDKYPFDVPASIIKNEMKQRMDGARREIQQAGKTEAEIGAFLSKMQESMEKQVENSIRMFFLMRHLANKCGISVTQNELMRELMMQMYTRAPSRDTSLDSEEARSKAYIDLLTQKVMDYLITQATLV